MSDAVSPAPGAAPKKKIRRPVSRSRWKTHAAMLDGLERDRPLRYLFLEVTRRCNLACAYCGSSCSPTEASKELTIAEWRDVVKQVAEDFNPKRVMVAVTGGEPLLREGVFDLFGELRRQGFPYGMVSNARLLDDAAAKALVQAGIGSISLSMDATPELNDKLRGKGSTLAVGKAIGALRAAGYRGKLEIITTVTRPVIPLLADVRRMVAEARVPLWRLGMVMPIGRAAERPDLVPGPEEVRTVLEFIRACRADGRLPSPEFCEEGYLGDRYERQVRPYLAQCRAGITTGGILRDGSIGACPELGRAYIQGHIGQDRFRDVWYGRYQVFRDRSWARSGRCVDCDSWDRCRGGALHLRDEPNAEFLRCLYLMLQEASPKKRKPAPRKKAAAPKKRAPTARA
jgi:radical SAM protein with 4Fe4S-binding SPASM domain